MLDVETLGQVFTPPQVVQLMLDLRQRAGRVLEPSVGDGAFYRPLRAQGALVTGIEIDDRVAPEGATIMDFFDLPLSERFDSIIGNPPYVRFQDIPAATKEKLDMTLFDQRSNLFLFFIEKCIRHLNPGGELIFIVPREFSKLTAARKLNHWLAQEGSITHFIETGDSRIFKGATPNCVIFRFEKGRKDAQMADGRYFGEHQGQLLFMHTAPASALSLSELFTVKVGAVSGADPIFAHPEGIPFVCSHTGRTGETRCMIYNQEHPHLAQHKATLLARGIRAFDETNWWQWGRSYPEISGPRIYVNGKTRQEAPFFLHECQAFDGAVLALFPRHPMSADQLAQCVSMLNRVDWAEQGFRCDGRYLFTQRSLQNCRLPAAFSRFLKND